MKLKLPVALLLFVCLVTRVQLPAAVKYPTTARTNQTDTYHGTVVPDLTAGSDSGSSRCLPGW